jgi:aryl-alcohol dehydrogenase-like predicted oxidoreductase
VISIRQEKHAISVEFPHTLVSNNRPSFLGNTGLRVSALSLGGWLTYGDQVDEELTLKCMEEAWENGINFFDTAEVYADGKCEVAMGKAIKKLGWKREDFVISTKLFWGGVSSTVRGFG